MEFEFDKEMESLLRKMAKGENVSALNGGHIDADEISMFAENVLPNAARPRVSKHLADCGKCRTILSNVIVLNSAAEAENASATFEEKEIVAVATTEIPWYQKLFATKNLAFGMGALALIFAVGIGFIVMQNASNSETADLVKADANTNVAMADQTSVEANDSTASDETANSNANADSSGEDSIIPDTNSSANVATDADGDEKISEQKESVPNAKDQNKGELIAQATPNAVGRARSNNESPREENILSDDEASTADVTVEKEENDKTKLAENSTMQNDGVAKTEMKPSSNSPSPVVTRKGVTVPKSPAKKKDNTEDRKDSKEANNTRQVNNKTFTRKKGVWYDSAYKNQSTTKVKRGSSAYKNLDTGLQSIGNQLSGTVYVIWNSKAYKIQ